MWKEEGEATSEKKTRSEKLRVTQIIREHKSAKIQCFEFFVEQPNRLEAYQLLIYMIEQDVYTRKIFPGKYVRRKKVN